MDNQLLKIAERLQLAIELGESHFREFKSAFQGPPAKKERRDPKAICVDIAQTLVAFANADGGQLIIGVEDDGTISGIDLSQDNISMLLSGYALYSRDPNI